MANEGLGIRKNVSCHPGGDEESASWGPGVTTQVSQQKKPSYFPLYWLVNRDPYNGLL